jgi:hypothetical protein
MHFLDELLDGLGRLLPRGTVRSVAGIVGAVDSLINETGARRDIERPSLTRDQELANELSLTINELNDPPAVPSQNKLYSAVTRLIWVRDELWHGARYVPTSEIDDMRQRLRIAEAVRDDARAHAQRLLTERRWLAAILRKAFDAGVSFARTWSGQCAATAEMAYRQFVRHLELDAADRDERSPVDDGEPAIADLGRRSNDAVDASEIIGNAELENGKLQVECTRLSARVGQACGLLEEMIRAYVNHESIDAEAFTRHAASIRQSMDRRLKRRPCIHCGRKHEFRDWNDDLDKCPACGEELYPVVAVEAAP